MAVAGAGNIAVAQWYNARSRYRNLVSVNPDIFIARSTIPVAVAVAVAVAFEVRVGERVAYARHGALSLALVIAVVETGSFTAAAERLGMTKAVVRQQVSRLESEFRTSLLIRTTRKVQPTETGRAFYLRCAMILREAEDAFDELAERSSKPAGTLRLTAPFDYGVGIVVPVIAAFMQRYPACKVDAIFSDQTLNMMSGNIELAIRVGWLAETGLQARRIGTFRQLLVVPSNQPDLLYRSR